MKYKVGDRVRIKNLDWYNRHTNETEIDCGGVPFTSGMKWFCSCVMTIRFVHADCYDMVEDSENYYTDEMIEGLAEEETLIERVDDKGLPFNEWLSHKGSFHVPDGYELKDENGNVINATKIVLEKKKKEYPKTFEECCELLSLGEDGRLYTKGYKASLIQNFQKLLVCRDAYWKIAGEEMGLGKPWAPNGNEDCFVISRSCGEVYLYSSAGDCEPFEFPTEEMRNAFYENFKDLIESCKELL